MSYKLIISKEGSNALTEQNVNNLLFSSDYNTLKYYTSGTITVYIYSERVEYSRYNTFTHNLNYYPFFVAYVNTSLGVFSNYRPVGAYHLGTGAGASYHVQASTTQLIAIVNGYSLNTPIEYYAYFKYKIFKNNLGL